MPCDYSKYPPNWKSEIRPGILKRDNNKCKFCGLQNKLQGWRDNQGNFYEAQMILDCMEKRGYDYFENELLDTFDKYGNPRGMITIVLTIAHLDHDLKNNHGDNLAALCQQCHLRHDAKHKAEKRKAKRYENQEVLF